jgi:hypothetical protein
MLLKRVTDLKITVTSFGQKEVNRKKRSKKSASRCGKERSIPNKIEIRRTCSIVNEHTIQLNLLLKNYISWFTAMRKQMQQENIQGEFYL